MRRGHGAAPGGVPAVLPQIIAEVLSEEQIVLTVNGQRLTGTPARRAELGRVIGELVTRLDSPTRVEVREQDGSVYADIITPVIQASPTPVPAAPDSTPRAELLEFTAGGFVPGEDVAIAIILRHSSAGPNGVAHALLDRAEQSGPTGEVILFGRISGTTSVQHIS
jgi:hypothetical protein